jgi:hypothetical protein
MKKFFTPAALLQWYIFIGTMLSTTFVNIPGFLMYAQIAGLIVQPAWAIATYKSKQWGPLALSIYFTFVWGAGLYNSITTLG